MENKRFNPEHADKLMSQERKDTIQPEKLIDHLHVTKDDMVADLGAGPGLFTLELAKRTEKDVYAVDVESDMLKQLRQNAEAEGLGNIKYLLSDLERINLPDQSVTRVINTFVAHEVSDIDQSIEEMKRLLTPGGHLLLADWEAVESESGPPLNIRIPSDEMERLLQAHDFSTELFHVGLEYYAIKATNEEPY